MKLPMHLLTSSNHHLPRRLVTTMQLQWRLQRWWLWTPSREVTMLRCPRLARLSVVKHATMRVIPKHVNRYHIPIDMFCTLYAFSAADQQNAIPCVHPNT